MGILKTPLYSAMKRQQMPRTETGEGHIGLSWYIETLPETKKKFLHIDGIVGGYTSFIGFDQEKNFGVVVLQNSINHDDMIGVTLLDRLVAAHQTKSRHQASK
jgi:CubicO group peptidase (beta-lactamase class C family)